MLKSILLTSTTLLLMSGCVTKEIHYQQAQTDVMQLESHTFAGETLTATPQVSQMVRQIKSLSSNSTYLELTSNQNIKVRDFLNITATPNQAGYLKLISIDPNGERRLLLPNSMSNGYLNAQQTFYSNNSQFTLQTTKPTGLHYIVVIFSEKNARVVMRQGMNGYDAINNDQDFIKLLQSIKNQAYGKSYISIFPIRIY